MRLKQGMQCCLVRRWCISDIILSSAVPLLGCCGEKLFNRSFNLISMFYSNYVFCSIFAIVQPDLIQNHDVMSVPLILNSSFKANLCRSRWSKDMPGSRMGSVFHLFLPVGSIVDPLLQLWLLQYCGALQRVPWLYSCRMEDRQEGRSSFQCKEETFRL